jgi:hypothetical protein
MQVPACQLGPEDIGIECAVLSMRSEKCMDLSRDIHPLTDFKRNTAEFLAQLKETGHPPWPLSPGSSAISFS